MDMAHMKADGSSYAKGKEVNFSDVWCSYLVGVDRGSGSLLCATVDSTSTGDDSQPKEYVTKMVTEWLKKKSYRKVTIRTDGETLIVAIVERIKAAGTEETILQRSPTRSSQSLGAAERAVRTVKEQFKTLRFQRTV